MRKVELRMNEQEKYDVIKNLVEKSGNKNRAAKKLGITRRQIDRLILTYKEKGKEGFIHGNRNKKPTNTIPDQISNDIVLLYENKYNIINDDYDAEVWLFCDNVLLDIFEKCLKQLYNISPEVI